MLPEIFSKELEGLQLELRAQDSLLGAHFINGSASALLSSRMRSLSQITRS